MLSIEQTIAAVGVLWSAAGVYWVFHQARGSFLQIQLTTDNSCGRLTALTKVTNASVLKKSLHWAVLVIGPEGEDPIITVDRVISKHPCLGPALAGQGELRSLKERCGRTANEPFWVNDAGVVPLPYYYEENFAVEDEILQYRASISKDLGPGPYSIRFFLYKRRRLLWRFLRPSHLVVQDLFMVDEDSEIKEEVLVSYP